MIRRLKAVHVVAMLVMARVLPSGPAHACIPMVASCSRQWRPRYRLGGYVSGTDSRMRCAALNGPSGSSRGGLCANIGIDAFTLRRTDVQTIPRASSTGRMTRATRRAALAMLAASPLAATRLAQAQDERTAIRLLCGLAPGTGLLDRGGISVRGQRLGQYLRLVTVRSRRQQLPVPRLHLGDPLPGEPKVAFSGLARAAATSSLIDFAFVFGPLAIATSNDATAPIGVKSLNGSYSSLL